jgi:hypothetical protein
MRLKERPRELIRKDRWMVSWNDGANQSSRIPAQKFAYFAGAHNDTPPPRREICTNTTNSNLRGNACFILNLQATRKHS